MKEIYTIDEANYQGLTKRLCRIAVRGIIFINGKLAMIQSEKYHEYKFPGGGQESKEDNVATLIREVKEETGLTVNPSTIKEYGYIHEIRKSIYNENEIFDMYSFYYFCDINPEVIDKTNYSNYEIDYGYHFVLVDINEAYLANKELLGSIGKKATWIKRENIILKKLLDIKK